MRNTVALFCYARHLQHKFLRLAIVCIRILSRRNVKGEIPPELGNMEALTEL